jgi:hypothetical protein
MIISIIIRIVKILLAFFNIFAYTINEKRNLLGGSTG